MKRQVFIGMAAVLSLTAGSAFAQQKETENETERETDTKLEVIDYPGTIGTFVSAVNDRGQLAGQFADAGGVGHAFTGRPGHLVAVDPDGVVGTSAFSAAYALNNAGVIGGSYPADPSLARGDHGYLMRGGEVVPVQYRGGLRTEVYGVNDFGQVVGGYFDAGGNVHAFELDDGVFTAEDVPGALATAPLAINDRGQIVGFFVTVAGTAGHGYIRERDGAIRLGPRPRRELTEPARRARSSWPADRSSTAFARS